MNNKLKYNKIDLLVLIASIIFLFIAFYLNGEFFDDDTYISLRYARHLFDGEGLVWNQGEYIQGYTNFFHIILTTAFNYIFYDLVHSVLFLNFIVYFSFIPLIYKHPYFKRFEELKLYLLISILCSMPIIIWTLGGLESVLFGFLIFFGIIEFEYKRENNSNYFYSGLLLILASLTRPEGLMFYVYFLFIAIAIKKDYKNIYLYLIPFVLLLSYLLFVYSYYGNILPNTYYAKSYGIGFFKIKFGIKYVLRLIINPMYLLLFILFFKIFFKEFKINYLDVIIVLFLIVMAQSGGDHMPAFRFYAHILPIVSLRLFILLNKNREKILKFLPFIKLIFILLLYLQLNVSEMMPMKKDQAAYVGEYIGKYIKSNWEEGSLIALATAGSTPFIADNFRYIDMLGLLDTTISKRKITEIKTEFQRITGHSKGDGNYVLSRKPDYLILGYSEGCLDKKVFLSDYEIHQSADFKNNYFPVIDTITTDKSDIVFSYYKRKE